MTNDEVRSILKNLAEVCRDGEEGFREAAEKLKSPDVKPLFREFSSQRASLAAELQTAISQLGGVPDASGTLSGAVHRGWINLKSMVTGHDDSAVISEAERGEDVAVRNYRDALTKDLPTAVREIVERQYHTVLDTHNKVRSLELKSQHA